MAEIAFLATAFLLQFASGEPDPADMQMSRWKENNPDVAYATDQKGIPNPSLTATAAISNKGPNVFDVNFFDMTTSFNRQRIPERVVHAKGAGAHGYFEVLHDVTQYTKAKVFETLGSKCKVTCRFSTVSGELGSADTVRNPRGFSCKFYTKEGNWDLLMNNIILVSVRDTFQFIGINTAEKRNPQTGLHNANMLWDFRGRRAETTMHALILFGPDGIPDGYRYMHGSAVNTFKLVNADGQAVYCKFHVRSHQGLRYISPEDAEYIAGVDPDYAIRDLYNAIEEQRYPSWTLVMQVMTYEEAKVYRWNPFDPTKFWRFEDHPMIPVGTLTLDRNVDNFFAETEQIAFDPGNLVPGIEPSPDKLLQARMFAYSDAQRYRHGTNFMQIPVNRPIVKVRTYMRDGMMCQFNQGGAPNYFPNSFNGPIVDPNANQSAQYVQAGDIVRHDEGDDDNYSFAKWYWRDYINAEIRAITIENFAQSLHTTLPFIYKRVLVNLGHIDSNLKRLVKQRIDELNSPAEPEPESPSIEYEYE